MLEGILLEILWLRVAPLDPKIVENYETSLEAILGLFTGFVFLDV